MNFLNNQVSSQENTIYKFKSQKLFFLTLFSIYKNIYNLTII